MNKSLETIIKELPKSVSCPQHCELEIKTWDHCGNVWVGYSNRFADKYPKPCYFGKDIVKGIRQLHKGIKELEKKGLITCHYYE